MLKEINAIDYLTYVSSQAQAVQIVTFGNISRNYFVEMELFVEDW